MRRLPILLLAAVALLASCGGDDGDTADSGGAGDPTGAPADGGSSSDGGACAVLSIDDVEAATGETVAGGTEQPAGCQWTLAGAAGGATYDYQSIPPEVYEANRTEAGSSFGIESIDGLGQEAYLRSSLDANGDPLTSETWVLVDDTGALYVRSTLPASDDVVAAERALAEALMDQGV